MCSFINIRNDFEDTFWETNQDDKGWSRTFSKTLNQQESCADWYVNLEEILYCVLSNIPGLLLAVHENPFPVTVNQTWLQSGNIL